MKPNKEFKIDYLQFSSERFPIWMINESTEFYKRSSKPFYTHETKFANGAMMYTGNPKTDKHLYVLSGSVCKKLSITADWMQSLVKDNGIISRIDFAMTTDTNVLKLLQRDRKHIVSEMYNDMKIISDGDYTPQTIYCGDMGKARKKKGILRAYDKGLQLGIDLKMYRIELELRQNHATIASKRYASNESIPSIMNAKFKVNKSWYHDYFGNDESTMRFTDTPIDPIPEIERKMYWLESQVLPSLQYVIDYDRDNGTSNFSRLISQLE